MLCLLPRSATIETASRLPVTRSQALPPRDPGRTLRSRDRNSKGLQGSGHCNTDFAERSQKAWVGDRQLCIQLSMLPASLAELLCFWCCQVRKLLKSCRTATFLMLWTTIVDKRLAKAKQIDRQVQLGMPLPLRYYYACWFSNYTKLHYTNNTALHSSHLMTSDYITLHYLSYTTTAAATTTTHKINNNSNSNNNSDNYTYNYKTAPNVVLLY